MAYSLNIVINFILNIVNVMLFYLEIEIKKMWEMKTTIVIGALGLVKKGTDVGKIPADIRITELQTAVLFRTAHTLRRTLSIK